jgi:hypothetical protein
MQNEVDKRPDKQIALATAELDQGKEGIFVFGTPFQTGKASAQQAQDSVYDINSNYMILVIASAPV